jgi:hypothetical protein
MRAHTVLARCILARPRGGVAAGDAPLSRSKMRD